MTFTTTTRYYYFKGEGDLDKSPQKIIDQFKKMYLVLQSPPLEGCLCLDLEKGHKVLFIVLSRPLLLQC